MSKALASFAFEALYSKLNSTSQVPLTKYFTTLDESADDLPSSAPLFITWNQDGRLRGCIGTFQAQPIESGVQKFALVAALQDTRFSPISKRELDSSLSVSVTLLDNFTPIQKWDDWTIGLNGLKLSFEYGNDYYSGTFLPSVAEEEKWDKETTLFYLLRKSDYSGIRSNKDVAKFYKKGLDEGWLKLTRYDGLKDSLTYDEFLEIKEEL